MKRAIIASTAIAIAMMATSAVAQDHTTEINLKAEIPIIVDMGSLTISGTAIPTGGSGIYSLTMNPNANGTLSGNSFRFDWDGAYINLPHTLSLHTLNGGLTSPGPARSGFLNKVQYISKFGWVFNGVFDVEASTTIVTSNVTAGTRLMGLSRTYRNGTISLTFDINETGGRYFPGTYSDVLTATISPIA